MDNVKTIRIRGARQNNLKSIDLDIPHRQWLAICGRSGSGKSSLAVQTLYAEGQRRYVESFSPYTRQFLDQAEKPLADRIESVPAAVVVNSAPSKFGRRTSIASVTEILEFVRLLYARLATIVCPQCNLPVEADHPQGIADRLKELSVGVRYMIGFDVSDWWGTERQNDDDTNQAIANSVKELGFARLVSGSNTVEVASELYSPKLFSNPNCLVVIDRLVAGKTSGSRIRESLETAMRLGNGRCVVWLPENDTAFAGKPVSIDNSKWSMARLSRHLECRQCSKRFRSPEPAMLSNTNPLGACPDCEGFGEKPEFSLDLIVPDRTVSIRDGAIAPWNVPSYRHELEELLALADDCGIPVDVPFAELGEREIELFWKGVPDRKFGGLNGFFRWLEKRKYKMQHRVFLARWRKWNSCPSCRGTQLNLESLALRIGETNLAEFLAMSANEARDFLAGLSLKPWQAPIAAPVLRQVLARLGFLVESGLGQLSLDRTMRSLSSGQAQRVMLTCSLSSSLVNMLYVLDEPTQGLHPENVRQILPAIERLHRLPNTLVVVDHSSSLIHASERVIELGPEAGELGGEVVFDGTPGAIVADKESSTGMHLSGRKGSSFAPDRRRKRRSEMVLTGACGRNLKSIDVVFPLGVLCVVSGVSGAGKTSLVRDTLLPRLASSDGAAGKAGLPAGGIRGHTVFEDAIWMDSAPPIRTGRSIPATYVKVFDEIRQLFASTADAKIRNLTAGKFSFNVSGGRCEKCKGDGRLAIDMQFLANVSMVCDDCHGQRFQQGPLEVKYRGTNIFQVLQMTANEAFSFFRGQPKIQAGLKALRDAGLDYIRLGQSMATLSRGETQRLKLAQSLSAKSRKRSLFVFETPTLGLHMDDVTKMVDCFHALLDVGHSLIVIEHNLQLMANADWIIDLGPGADEDGGQIVAEGTPEQIASSPDSMTGKHLKAWLEKYA